MSDVIVWLICVLAAAAVLAELGRRTLIRERAAAERAARLAALACVEGGDDIGAALVQFSESTRKAGAALSQLRLAIANASRVGDEGA